MAVSKTCSFFSRLSLFGAQEGAERGPVAGCRVYGSGQAGAWGAG